MSKTNVCAWLCGYTQDGVCPQWMFVCKSMFREGESDSYRSAIYKEAKQCSGLTRAGNLKTWLIELVQNSLTSN